MSTKREPLLSDDDISSMWYFGDPSDVKNLDVPPSDAVPDDYYEWGAKDVRDIYEAARAKDAELIDELTQKLDEANRLAQNWGLQVAKNAELIQQLVDALSWYVSEDDTMEGGQWDIDNAPWIEGRNEAISILDAAEAAGFKPSEP